MNDHAGPRLQHKVLQRCDRRLDPQGCHPKVDSEPEKLEVELTRLLETGLRLQAPTCHDHLDTCRENIGENDFVTRVRELGNRLGYRDECLDLAGEAREFIAKGLLAGRDAVVR